MWVKMTQSAYNALLRVAITVPHLQEEFTDEVATTPKRVLVRAPYIAWNTARDMLYAITFGPRGGKRQATQREFSALRSIQRELNYVDTHPALRGVGMLGWQNDVFYVWPTGDADRPWSPMPVVGQHMVILHPVWRDKEQTKLPKSTVWEVRPPSAEDRLAEEQVHMRLWRQPSR